MTTENRIDALVVGAGPVGLTMAAELTRHGVRCRIVERAAARTDKSKALVLWPRSLELLTTAAAVEPFLASGLRATGARVHADGRQLARLNVTGVRAVNPTDANGGFDPGLIPPVPPGFTGFLVCVETTVDGFPVGGNSLTGLATIGDITTLGGTNNVSKYNAIGIPACNGNSMPMNNPGLCGPTSGVINDDKVLSLDGVEYAACPGGLYVNFIGDGAQDPAIALAGNDPSVVSTNLTFIPCAIDFENLEPEQTSVTFAIRNEFEENLSISPVQVDCWYESLIGDLGPPFVMTESGLGSTFGKAIVTPIGPGLAPVLGVANVLRTAGDGSSDTAATNLHFCTDATDPPGCPSFNSEIRLP